MAALFIQITYSAVPTRIERHMFLKSNWHTATQTPHTIFGNPYSEKAHFLYINLLNVVHHQADSCTTVERFLYMSQPSRPWAFVTTV